MSSNEAPVGVHLVGTIPLESSAAVFELVGKRLGGFVRRIPDGETGDRQLWVVFQLQVLSARPEWEVIENVLPGWEGEVLPPTLRLRDGIAPSEVNFRDLGYASTARDSYAVFRSMQEQQRISAEARFQVGLPTPLANATMWMQSDPSFLELLEAYTVGILAEVQDLCEAIPHDRLAIQWDVCFELLMFEGWMPMPDGLDRATVARHLSRIANAVPPDVEVGFHFCFGDHEHKHMREPTDTGRIVELFGAFRDQLQRPVAWIHIPVPIDRDDAAYFEPLTRLAAAPTTEIYLGLVHFRDGVAGAQRRIETAQAYVPRFGVATECGMGRRPPERGGAGDTLAELLDLHAAVANPL